jgi:hypothetical protein
VNIWSQLGLALGLSAFITTNSLAVSNPSFSGSILRDTSVDFFDFTIKIANIQKNDLQPKEQDLFKDRIRVWLSDLSISNDEFIPFEGGTPIDAVPFTLSQSDELKREANGSLTDFTYSVRITANLSGGLKKLLDEKGGSEKKDVKIRVKYYEDKDSQEKTSGDWTISVSSAVVQDTPSGVTAKGTHKALVVAWAVSSNVTWSDNSQKAPTSVTALVIDKATTTTDVPAYIYNSSSVTDSEAAAETCVFDPNFAEGSNCINCGDPNAYLNTPKLQLMSTAGYFNKTISNPSLGKAQVTGLTNDKPYAVVMFYGPGGLNRSSCITATPLENNTWSEINGEDEASLLDPKCFIATAAYGSVLHENLRPLRWFRDRVLMKNSLGRAFVEQYYESGPKAAVIVASYPSLAMIVRGLLWFPVIILSVWMSAVGSDSQWSMIVLLGGCVATVAAVLWVKHRKKGV